MRPLLVLSILAMPALAFAQTEGAPSDAAREEARGVLVEAVAAFENESFERALELFERAKAIAPRVEIEFNIAMCLERLDRLEEAKSAYQRALDSGQLDAESAARARVRIEDVDRRIAEAEAGRVQAEVAQEPAHATSGARAPSEALRPDRPAEPAPRVVGPLFWIGLAVAVVGGGGIVGFGLRTEELGSEFRDNPVDPTADEGELMRALTNISIGVAALGGILALVDLLFVD